MMQHSYMYDILCTAYDNIHTLSPQATIFMMSHPLQAWQHSPCIRHCTHFICHHTVSTDISLTFVWHHTNLLVTSYELYRTSHPNLMSSHFCTYDITASIYETTSNMRATCTLIMWHPVSIWVITPTVQTTSHPLFLWHHTRHMCGIFCTIQNITYSLYDIKQQFFWHHTNYIWHVIHCICVITPTLSMISQTLYVWYHIQYVCDIISTIFIT